MLDQFPNAVIELKQVLASLVFRQGKDSLVPLIDPLCYKDALTVKQLFMSLAPHWNPLSTDLLVLLLEAFGCSMEAAKVAEARNSTGHLVLCVRQMPSLVDFRSAHNAPLSKLRSLHHCLFVQLPKHRVTAMKDTVRISVEVDKEVVDLSDYEKITTALSGLLWMPKVAFVFAGCIQQPIVLSWLTIPEISACSWGYVTDISGSRLLAESSVTKIAVGEWLYVCPSIEV